MTQYETLIALVLICSTILYGITGIADFGGGILELFVFGKREEQQRKAINNSLAPIWEANHVWLIAIVVVFFTAFPKAFAIIMSKLFVAIFFVLIGIVLRGAAFIFRRYSEENKLISAFWIKIFDFSCLIVPFLLGAIVGALASGDLENIFVNNFALACGFFTLVLSTHLAATYLAADNKNHKELANDFRIISMTSLMILLLSAFFLFSFTRDYAPYIYLRLLKVWFLESLAIIIWILDMFFLYSKDFTKARFLSAALVSIVILGWLLAQYPFLIVGSIKIYDMHAPESVLINLLLVIAIAALIIFPAFFYLYYIFIKSRPNA